MLPLLLACTPHVSPLEAHAPMPLSSDAVIDGIIVPVLPSMLVDEAVDLVARTVFDVTCPTVAWRDGAAHVLGGCSGAFEGYEGAFVFEPDESGTSSGLYVFDDWTMAKPDGDEAVSITGQAVVSGHAGEETAWISEAVITGTVDLSELGREPWDFEIELADVETNLSEGNLVTSGEAALVDRGSFSFSLDTGSGWHLDAELHNEAGNLYLYDSETIGCIAFDTGSELGEVCL